MNAQTKIIQQNGAYVGHLIENQQIIYTTAPCANPNAASRLLSQHLATLNQANYAPTIVQQVERPLAATNTNQPPQPQQTQTKSGGCGCRRG